MGWVPAILDKVYQTIFFTFLETYLSVKDLVPLAAPK